jgi:hypothetical protein
VDPRTRFALFIYGNKNIAGSLLGLGALAAYFTGLIHEWWYAIVAGAYGIGFAAAPGSPLLETEVNAQMSNAQIENALTQLNAQTKPLLNPDAYALVASISSSIVSILPNVSKTSIADEQLFTVRQTALQYLPQTLQNYLNLPPAFRNVQPLESGKTAKAVLMEQLTLLDRKMKEIVSNVVNNDSQALLANGTFLAEKLKKPEFLTVS